MDPKGTSQESYIDVGLRLSTMQSYLAAIVESSDDAIISKDLNGTIQSFKLVATVASLMELVPGRQG